jgi:signal transduction histidine kinase
VEKVEPVPVGVIAREVGAQFEGRHPVTVIEHEPCTVSGNSHSIEQVLVHLVQNAVDASEAQTPVFIAIARQGKVAAIEVLDRAGDERGFHPHSPVPPLRFHQARRFRHRRL